MVRKGDYTVELIEAETKKAFKEHQFPSHTANDEESDICVEVEPDIEYFVRVENHSSTKAFLI